MTAEPFEEFQSRARSGIEGQIGGTGLVDADDLARIIDSSSLRVNRSRYHAEQTYARLFRPAHGFPNKIRYGKGAADDVPEVIYSQAHAVLRALNNPEIARLVHVR